MKLFKLFTTALLIFTAVHISAQEASAPSELSLIEATLMDYIEGTGNGQPEKLARAFHPDFNLYSVTSSDSLRIWEGKDYVGGITPGKKSNRIGRIIAIDHENNAATAKVEILIPGWRVFTDYFLLLKYEGSWKIVHKSYTWREIEKKE